MPSWRPWSSRSLGLAPPLRLLVDQEHGPFAKKQIYIYTVCIEDICRSQAQACQPTVRATCLACHQHNPPGNLPSDPCHQHPTDPEKMSWSQSPQKKQTPKSSARQSRGPANPCSLPCNKGTWPHQGQRRPSNKFLQANSLVE